jgi:hypothetical protein
MIYVSILIFILDKEKLWKKLEYTGITPLQRSGHTAILYKHELFFYGGILEDSGFKGVAKEDILIYDTSKSGP